MGKTFPTIFSLSEKSHLLGQTLALIEKSFGYEAPFQFKNDFAPLLTEENLKNCFILVNEGEEVLAHLGARVTSLRLDSHSHTLCMLGGIAVDESQRGKGYLSLLMNHVMSELRDEVAAFILWSNLELYQKYGFNLCGSQYESTHTPSTQSLFKKTKYGKLSLEEKKQIQKLYQLSLISEPGIARGEKDWEAIEQIIDADLYIETKGQSIESYFFVGKGQDLQGVAHEFGSLLNLSELRKRARKVAKVWGPSKISAEDTEQFQFMLAPGDRYDFQTLVQALSQKKINVTSLNQINQKIVFEFEGQEHTQEIFQFLPGLLGPGRFEELKGMKSIFIRGLDSI